MWSQQVAYEFSFARDAAQLASLPLELPSAPLRAQGFALLPSFCLLALLAFSFAALPNRKNSLPNGGSKKETLYTLKEKFDIMSRYGFQ